MATPGANYRGWKRNDTSTRLDIYYGATKVAHITSAGALVALTTVDATTIVTGGTGVTATTGNITVTAGHLKNTAGNVDFAAVGARGTTAAVGAVNFKTTTKPVGAATNTASLYAATNGTAVHKMDAAGTESNVET